jgi:hypothetical protein
VNALPKPTTRFIVVSALRIGVSTAADAQRRIGRRDQNW